MSDTPSESSYLTIAQVAESLSCSPDSIRRLIARGELRAYRFGRLIRIAAADVARAGRPIAGPRRALPKSSEVPRATLLPQAGGPARPGKTGPRAEQRGDVTQSRGFGSVVVRLEGAALEES